MVEINGVVVPERVVLAAEVDVRRATKTARYDTDIAGVASDPKIRDALTAARDEQIRAYLKQEEADQRIQASAAATPLGRPLASASIGGASWTAETGTSGVSEAFQIPAGGGLCSAALAILDDAGLLNGWIGYYG